MQVMPYVDVLFGNETVSPKSSGYIRCVFHLPDARLCAGQLCLKTLILFFFSQEAAAFAKEQDFEVRGPTSRSYICSHTC